MTTDNDTVARIASNDPLLTELRLGESAEHYFEDVTEIVDALRENTSITMVRIDREFLPSLLGRPEKKAAVVIAIGKLPNLVSLRIMSGPVHAVVLGKALSDAAQLEVLELGAVNMKGDAEDFKALEDSLHSHTNLHTFTMANFTVDQDEIDMDPLIKSLATITSLKKLTLEAHRTEKAHFSGEALASLTYASGLDELKIGNFRLYVQHYELISDALKTSTNLKTLRLNRVGMANPCSIKLSEGLVVNKTLEMLDLSSNNIADEGCMALAAAFKENTSVTHFRLWDNKLITGDGFDALADMLQVNTTLEKLDMPMSAGSEYRTKVDETLREKRNAALAA